MLSNFVSITNKVLDRIESMIAKPIIFRSHPDAEFMDGTGYGYNY